MPFKLKCPKCESPSCTIERDTRSGVQRGDVAELMLICRCGKQLFAQQVVEEIDRQRSAWEAAERASAASRRQQTDQERAERDRDVQIRTALARHASRQRQRDEEEARKLREEEHKRWLERIGRQTGEDERAVAVAKTSSNAASARYEPAATNSCAWHECSNAPRPNSMYCSRDCSNKNARDRHAQRKRGSRAAA